MTKREAVLKTYYSKRAVSKAFGWSMADAGYLCDSGSGARGEHVVAKYANSDSALEEKAIRLLAKVGIGGYTIDDPGEQTQ